MKLVMRQFMGYRPLAETLSSDWLSERDYVRTPQSRELHFLLKFKSNKSVIIFYSAPVSVGPTKISVLYWVAQKKVALFDLF